MRAELWPHGSPSEHLAEMQAILAEPARFTCLIAQGEAGEPLGFAEAAIRHDYVNGTRGSPAGFLEGLFVMPQHRGKGLAKRLVEAVAAWVRACNCTELASNTELDNELSRKVHEALGFRETERVVYFCKRLVNEP